MAIIDNKNQVVDKNAVVTAAAEAKKNASIATASAYEATEAARSAADLVSKATDLTEQVEQAYETAMGVTAQIPEDGVTTSTSRWIGVSVPAAVLPQGDISAIDMPMLIRCGNPNGQYLAAYAYDPSTKTETYIRSSVRAVYWNANSTATWEFYPALHLNPGATLRLFLNSSATSPSSKPTADAKETQSAISETSYTVGGEEQARIMFSNGSWYSPRLVEMTIHTASIVTEAQKAAVYAQTAAEEAQSSADEAYSSYSGAKEIYDSVNPVLPTLADYGFIQEAATDIPASYSTVGFIDDRVRAILNTRYPFYSSLQGQYPEANLPEYMVATHALATFSGDTATPYDYVSYSHLTVNAYATAEVWVDVYSGSTQINWPPTAVDMESSVPSEMAENTRYCIVFRNDGRQLLMNLAYAYSFA